MRHMLMLDHVGACQMTAGLFPAKCDVKETFLFGSMALVSEQLRHFRRRIEARGRSPQ